MCKLYIVSLVCYSGVLSVSNVFSFLFFLSLCGVVLVVFTACLLSFVFMGLAS